MFFTFFIVVILLLILSIIFSKIEIKIENVDISTIREKGKKIYKDYKIQISILAFYKITILKIKIDQEKIKKLTSNPKLKTIDTDMIKNIKPEIKFNTILRNLKLELLKLNLKIGIGTEDAAVTAIITGIISTILGLMLGKQTYNKDENIFSITPIYSSKNILKIKLNCIFTINLIHYIYKNIIKERRKRNERKSSNRRAYAYNNE